MPDKKLTDKEIVKALECCISNKTCEEVKCPLYENGCEIDIQIPHRLALDLINRLQAENDTLRSVVKQNHLIRDNNKSPLSLLTAEIKAEAYKEFAEKMKGVIPGIDDTYIESFVEDYIDNLLKEMEGEDNAKEKE